MNFHFNFTLMMQFRGYFPYPCICTCLSIIMHFWLDLMIRCTAIFHPLLILSKILILATLGRVFFLWILYESTTHKVSSDSPQQICREDVELIMYQLFIYLFVCFYVLCMFKKQIPCFLFVFLLVLKIDSCMQINIVDHREDLFTHGCAMSQTNRLYVVYIIP